MANEVHSEVEKKVSYPFFWAITLFMTFLLPFMIATWQLIYQGFFLSLFSSYLIAIIPLSYAIRQILKKDLFKKYIWRIALALVLVALLAVTVQLYVNVIYHHTGFLFDVGTIQGVFERASAGTALIYSVLVFALGTFHLYKYVTY